MNKIFNKIFIYIFNFTLNLFQIPKVDVKTAILIDYDSDEIIYEVRTRYEYLSSIND